MSTNTRNTVSRQTVEHILQSHPRPLTLHELYEYSRIALPHIAYSTVYRIIRRLETETRVVRVDWRERGSRYEWVEQNNHHHHIVCSVCGAHSRISDKDVNFSQKKIERATGYLTHHHAIELEGICPGCQRSAAKTV